MQLRIAVILLTLAAGVGSIEAQTQWTRPASIQSGQPGEAVVVVDAVDAAGRRISASFAESEFAVTLNVTSGTHFRGFGDAGVDTQGFSGLAEVLVGDRIRVFGTGGSTGVIQAEDVRLLGRQVSVADTALPSSIEGVVRSVNRSENRFTVESADRRLWTIEGEATTPVEFEGRTFAIGNLEAGDSVRVSVESWDGSTPLAATVTVTADARDAMESVTSLSGRITAVRPSTRTIVLETARGERVTVDLSGSTDESGRRLSMSDFSIGREIDATGRRMIDGTFLATTVRGIEASSAQLEPLRTIDVSGVLISLADDDGWIRVDTEDGPADILVDPAQPVRFPGPRWSTPAALRGGDRIRVRGVDAGGGALVAQVIDVIAE